MTGILTEEKAKRCAISEKEVIDFAWSTTKDFRESGILRQALKSKMH